MSLIAVAFVCSVTIDQLLVVERISVVERGEVCSALQIYLLFLLFPGPKGDWPSADRETGWSFHLGSRSVHSRAHRWQLSPGPHYSVQRDAPSWVHMHAREGATVQRGQHLCYFSCHPQLSWWQSCTRLRWRRSPSARSITPTSSWLTPGWGSIRRCSRWEKHQNPANRTIWM